MGHDSTAANEETSITVQQWLSQMGVLDIVTYWWPGILAVLLLLLGAIGPGGPEIVVVIGLLVLQIIVIGYRVIRFGVNEVRARSVQEKYQE